MAEEKTVVYILIKTALYDGGSYEIISVRKNLSIAIQDAEEEMEHNAEYWYCSEEENEFILAQWFDYEHKWILSLHCEEIK